MKKKVRSTPKGRAVDPQALAEVQALLGSESRQRDLLIEHLHKVNDRYGHLSAKHLAALAAEMKLSLAEVYETDVGRVKVGQRATVRSPAFDAPLSGTVDRIGMKIGKQDVLDTDPIARVDSRVVEVRVKLDDSAKAAGFSQMHVEVAIEP